MGLIYFVYCHTPLIKNVITLYDLAKGKKYEIGGKSSNLGVFFYTINQVPLHMMGIMYYLASHNVPLTENTYYQ